MHTLRGFLAFAGLVGMACADGARAANPLVLDQFTADPSAHVFDGRVYVYPSHDILAAPGRGRPGWFCMEDYHVFSSGDLTTWKDHGVIVSQSTVPWVDATKYSMWAPDCVSQGGKYFFYFPAIAKSGGFRIGVATADRPEGPFTPEPEPIEGVRGIDPCVFIDKDGTAYLYYALKQIFVARLKDNMRELAEAPQAIANLPAAGLIEGPFVFERGGIYYLTYPHVEHKTERLEYATSNHPLGPFKPAGVLMDELPSGCWTNHPSVVEFQGEWILFYHDKNLSPGFDKARSMCADRLTFEPDGSMRKVVPTLRGVGVVDAASRIEVDRFSEAAAHGVSAPFLDPGETSTGWKLSLAGRDAWARFDRVAFGAGGFRAVAARAASASGGVVEVRVDARDGPVLARIEVPRATEWQTLSAPVAAAPFGMHDVILTWVGPGGGDVDWIRFE